MSFGGEVGSCSVAEVMGTEMFTVTPETAVSSAQRLVLENDVHHMLVLENGTLAGIVCRDDLRFADVNARIGDCMTSPVLCITPDTTLQEAVDIMGANDIDCLPVVTGVFLVGIVTMEALSTANLSAQLDEPASSGAEAEDGGDVESESADDEVGPAFEAASLGEVMSADREAEAHARPTASCVACGDHHDVVSVGGGSQIPLCIRCRRVMLSNQRC